MVSNKFLVNGSLNSQPLLIISRGFRQFIPYYSLFTYIHDKTSILVLVYVDDIIITGNNDDAIAEIKQFFAQSFSIKDLDNLRYFLGIEVSQSKQGIFLCQIKYTLDLREEGGWGMLEEIKINYTPVF